MQTVSSASRTFIAVVSAVEWTATVLIPISRQARWIRRAISPRLAISTFSNITGPGAGARSVAVPGSDDQHQHRAVFDRFAVADQDALDAARARRADLVHHFHCLDDQQWLACGDDVAGADEGGCSRLRRQIGGSDHRRFDG